MDPDRISNIDDWLRFYKQKYTNLVIRPSDGAFLVLGPTSLDRENPIKTFPMRKGADAVQYVVGGENADIRAAAGEHLKTAAAERHAAVAAADAAYRSVEKEMLGAVQTWKNTATTAERAVAALEVGRLQAHMVTLDRGRQEARYPQRFIQSATLPRQLINYETRDERVIPYPVFRGVLTTATIAERTIAVDTL